MVCTTMPPDYCDNDMKVILQQTLSGVNFLASKDHSIIPRGNIGLRFQGIEIYQVMTGLTPSLSNATVL